MELILGGVYRTRISIESENGVTFANSDWEVVFAVGNKRAKVSTGIVVDDNTIDVYLDTSPLTVGKLKAQLNMEVIDTDAPGGSRNISVALDCDDIIIPSL
jgi:hypothetical protein